MPRPPAKSRYLKAIKANRGVVVAVCQSLGVERTAFYRMAKRHPELWDAVNEAREELVDMAEARLHQRVAENDWQAINLVLKTLGRKRGYVERQELVGDPEQPVTVSIVREVVDSPTVA
jgi:hypothetical protein